MQVRDGQLVGVAPAEKHPIAQGKICSRGWAAHEAPLWGNRTLHPSIRRNGNPETVSWDDALNYVSARLRDLLVEHKQVGVLGSARAANEENYLAGRLARAALGTNNVDFAYGAVYRPLLAGLEDVRGPGLDSLSMADIESSGAIVLVEGDLAKTHARVASSVLRALRSGARLIAIGNARTQMARLASCFLPAAPGCEGSVIAGLLAAVLRHDSGRSGGDTHWSGVDEMRATLRDVHTTRDMRKAAGWLAAERVVFLMGPTGAGPQRLRTDAAALASLAAVTGHLGKSGSGLLLLPARANVRGACDMGLAPDRLPGHQHIEDTAARQRLEDVWRRNLPAAPGLDAHRMIESVSGLIVVSDDPAAVLPQGKRARAALERLELLVVLDSFVTPAVNIAHVALPVASPAETTGSYTSLEGRVQRIRPAASPPGEAREGWRVLAELYSRFDAGVTWNDASDVFREIVQAVPPYRIALDAFDDAWGSAVVDGQQPVSVALRSTAAKSLATSAHPYVLARDGAFEWGDDPLYLHSPTLSREYLSARKLFPEGFVYMNSDDTDALGVRVGWRVKLRSLYGEAVVHVRPRVDLRHGSVVAPYGLRNAVAAVLGEQDVIAVNVERA